MEHINKITMENKISKEKIQLVTLIGIYLAIILLLIAIIVLVKNIQEIKSDPISYGIEKHNFNICVCYDMNGNSYDYNATGVIPKKVYGWNINFEE